MLSEHFTSEKTHEFLISIKDNRCWECVRLSFSLINFAATVICWESVKLDYLLNEHCCNCYGSERMLQGVKVEILD